MDDDIAIVEHDPAAHGQSFDAGIPAELCADGFIDRRKECLELPFVVGGADHEVIGERRQRPQVEQDDVAGLLFVGELDDAPCDGDGFDGRITGQMQPPFVP